MPFLYFVDTSFYSYLWHGDGTETIFTGFQAIHLQYKFPFGTLGTTVVYLINHYGLWVKMTMQYS